MKGIVQCGMVLFKGLLEIGCFDPPGALWGEGDMPLDAERSPTRST